MLGYIILAIAVILTLSLCWAVAYTLGHNAGVSYTLDILRKERNRTYDNA